MEVIAVLLYWATCFAFGWVTGGMVRAFVENRGWDPFGGPALAVFVVAMLVVGGISYGAGIVLF